MYNPIKKVGTLVFLALFSAGFLISSAVPAMASHDFEDVPEDHTFHDAISYIADEGIVNGYRDGRYGPDDPMTRGQLAAIFTRAFDFRHSTENYFSDIADSIFRRAINALAAAGIVNGYGNGEYGPNDPVTRGQVAAILVRITGLNSSDVPDYFWDDEGSSFEDAINTLAHYGITSGCRDAMFCPQDTITRGEMAALTKRALSLGDNPSPNPGIPEKGPLPSGGTPEMNKLLAEILAAQRGWTGEQFACLHALIMTESEWVHTAQNPISTAYGVFQFLDSTWSTVGAKKTSDPYLQTVAGLDYVEKRYGTPCSAWSYKKIHGYY